MPVLDAVFVGKIHLPDIWGGPIVPPGPIRPPEGEKPPGIWGGGNEPFPTPPIVIVIPPDGLAPGVPTHPIYLPVYPAHPIVIPPDAIAPGVPTHPIWLPPTIWPSPGRPAHPIVIPPDTISPGVPAHPIYLPPTVWPPLERPAHPIALPPDLPPTQPPTEPPTTPDAPTWQWVWNQELAWHPAFVPVGGKPQPVPPPTK